jgi:hypothetical protein
LPSLALTPVGKRNFALAIAAACGLVAGLIQVAAKWLRIEPYWQRGIYSLEVLLSAIAINLGVSLDSDVLLASGITVLSVAVLHFFRTWEPRSTKKKEGTADGQA